MQVLIVYGNRDHSQRYRCQHLAEQLRLFQVPCRMAELRTVTRHILASATIVIFHRVPYDKFIGQSLQWLRHNKRLVLFDTDDLIFEPAALPYVRSLQRASNLERKLYAAEVRGYQRMLEMTDAAIVTTEFLAERAKKYQAQVILHRNAFSAAMLSAAHTALQQQGESTGLVLGYASGTATHDLDFAPLQSVLRRLLVQFPACELHLLGPLTVKDNWGSVAAQVKRFPLIDWQDLPARLAQFTINLAPLEIANPFCQAKSELKYLEAALVKVPTVATPTNAFKHTISSGENGFLAATAEDWRIVLQQLLVTPARCKQYGSVAQCAAFQSHHPVKRGYEILTALRQLIEERGIQAPISQAVLEQQYEQLQTQFTETATAWRQIPAATPEMVPGKLNKLRYALRYRGASTVTKQTFVMLAKRWQSLKNSLCAN